MSRAALVIICDFLLISLLSLANFEEPARQAPPPQTAGVDARAVSNLVEVMQQALEQERLERARAQEKLTEAERALQNREQLLAEREKQVEEKEQSLQEIERRARELAQERERLRQATEAARRQLEQLQQQQAEAEKQIQELSTSLRVASAEASITKEQSEAIQKELAARRAEVERLQQQMAELEAVRRKAEEEKQRYQIELTRVETEAAIVREQLDENRKLVQTLNVEKAELRQHAATLAQGVGKLAEETTKLRTNLAESVETLAAKSEAIKTEILQAQPLAPNTIFNEFLTNSLQSAFRARRTSTFGDIKTEPACRTVLFTDGTNTFALYHLDSTPLGSVPNPVDWEIITGSLGRGLNHFPLSELQLTALDPRLVVAPLTPEVVTNLQVKVYPLAKDPFRFQQAVVVGAKHDYYGEVEFSLDPDNPAYLKMQRKPIGGLFSGSLPSRGDLVFTRHGELLGLMVNDNYCLLLQRLPVTRKVRLGPGMANQPTAQIMTQLARQLESLPGKFR
ncbi:MAG: hypothetical protein D6766_13075 [Verrucomicrobia bacterium]|nr:MAG: hypothetical protein D6766_13075 [Verrucomicrobiota bacterium]